MISRFKYFPGSETFVSELQYAVAQAFKVRGREDMTVREFIFVLSFDLKWFSPEEAKKILFMAKKRGLVEIDGDRVVLKFRVSSIQIPFGFKPSEKIWRDVGKPIMERIKERVIESSEMSEEEVNELIKKRLEEFHNLILPEVAALLVASKYCDVSDLKEEVMGLVFSRESRDEPERHSAE